MKNTRLLKLVLLGGLVLGQGALQQNSARAGLEEDYDSLSHEVNEVRGMARQSRAEEVARVLVSSPQVAPVTDMRYTSLTAGSDFSDLPEWLIVCSHIVTAGGKRLSSINVEKADALYTRDKALHDGKPIVMAARAASAAGTALKPVGGFLNEWVGKPGVKLAAGQIFGFYAGFPLLRAAGTGCGLLAGAISGPVTGAVVSKGLHGLLTALYYVPGGQPIVQFVAGREVGERVLPHAYKGVKYAAGKAPSLFEKLTAHFRKRPEPAAS